MDEFNIRIDGDKVLTPGVDFGARMRVVHRKGEFLVLRVPGKTGWSGIGSQSYYGPKWMLVQLRTQHVSSQGSASGRAFTRDYAEVLEELQPSKGEWRAAKKALVMRCDSANPLVPTPCLQTVVVNIGRKPFKLSVGDLVTTNFMRCNPAIVRRITALDSRPQFASGACATADGGQYDEDRSIAKWIDASWFKKVKVRS